MLKLNDLRATTVQRSTSPPHVPSLNSERLRIPEGMCASFSGKSQEATGSSESAKKAGVC